MVYSKPTLEVLGLRPGQISEVILSTYNPDGSPNGAPMGVSLHDPDSQLLVIRPFAGSWTYRNLMAKPHCVLNLTDDPEAFFRLTFKEVNANMAAPPEWFTEATRVDAPRLMGAYAYIEAEVVSRQRGGGRGMFLCRPLHVESLAAEPKAYCRAAHAVIESVIHASRVKVFSRRGWQHEVSELAAQIAHYRRLVDRVAPNSRYSQIMEEILRLMGGWGVKPP